jgi:hypothetical protein
MNKQTADFLETLEGLLTVLEERAKTDMMTMGSSAATLQRC